MSCYRHGYSWPSLVTSPYRSSPLASLQGYILYPHIAAVCMFELVVLLLPRHMWGSIGVHHLWAHINTAVLMHYLAGEKAWWQLQKNVVSNIEQVLVATPHKAPTIRPPASLSKSDIIIIQVYLKLSHSRLYIVCQKTYGKIKIKFKLFSWG